MKPSLFGTVLFAAAVVAAARAPSRAEDALSDAYAGAAASAQSLRDTRQTDDYPYDLYPKGPVSAITFFGFDRVKSDNDSYEDSLCDRDAENLEQKLSAALGSGDDRSRFVVSKVVDPQPPQRICERVGGRNPREVNCYVWNMTYCGTRLSTTSPRHRFQFKLLPDRLRQGREACEADLAREETPTRHVIASLITVWRPSVFNVKDGCGVQVLEVLADP
jgi:hypothetical protein